MFQIKFDGSRGMPFPGTEARPTEVAAHRVAWMARVSISARPQVALSLTEWFGPGAATDAMLLLKIRRMFEVISDDSRTVTFVDGRTHDLHVSYNPENIYEPPTLEDQQQPKQEMASVLKQIRERGAAPPSTTKTALKKTTHLGGPRIAPGADAGGFYGYAFPIDNRDTDSPTDTHQGSGMRVYLGKAYFGTGVVDRERAQTIYHELTHKIIGTNDHFYGPALCRTAAARGDPDCRRNADSFGYFVTSLDGHNW
jgi:Lysine-specific metallo-endopeptidase